jgi:hypothetical protein
MRKTISVNENKVQLKVKAPKLRDENEKHIVLTVCDQDKKIQSLLEYIKVLVSTGHGFDVVVDPKSDSEKSFYIDGDGTDHILDISIEEFSDMD